jgi:hypothetical protein
MLAVFPNYKKSRNFTNRNLNLARSVLSGCRGSQRTDAAKRESSYMIGHLLYTKRVYPMGTKRLDHVGGNMVVKTLPDNAQRS